ncbi:haloacid dehalogenase-like hydrolase, partial [Nannochloropsis oceanica]
PSLVLNQLAAQLIFGDAQVGPVVRL